MLCTAFIPIKTYDTPHVEIAVAMALLHYSAEIKRAEKWIESLKPIWMARVYKPGMFEISFEV